MRPWELKVSAMKTLTFDNCSSVKLILEFAQFKWEKKQRDQTLKNKKFRPHIIWIVIWNGDSLEEVVAIWEFQVTPSSYCNWGDH